MEELTNKIQAVINTLEGLDIKSTFDNMNKLLGCQQTLADVRDELQRREVKVNGDSDV